MAHALPSPSVSASYSFGTQGNDRIDPHRSSGRQPGGKEGDDGNEQHDGDEGDRIGRADAVKEAVQQTGGGERPDHAGYQTDRDNCHRLTDNETEDGVLSRPERNPNPNF